MDGAGVAGSAVLTNATSVSIGSVDSSTFNLGNGLIVTNGGSFYSGNLVIGAIGSGNPSSVATGNQVFAATSTNGRICLSASSTVNVTVDAHAWFTT